jgi:hypothetical protein
MEEKYIMLSCWNHTRFYAGFYRHKTLIQASVVTYTGFSGGVAERLKAQVC